MRQYRKARISKGFAERPKGHTPLGSSGQIATEPLPGENSVATKSQITIGLVSGKRKSVRGSGCEQHAVGELRSIAKSNSSATSDEIILVHKDTEGRD